jgi:hypothetical protein
VFERFRVYVASLWVLIPHSSFLIPVIVKLSFIIFILFLVRVSLFKVFIRDMEIARPKKHTGLQKYGKQKSKGKRLLNAEPFKLQTLQTFYSHSHF